MIKLVSGFVMNQDMIGVDWCIERFKIIRKKSGQSWPAPKGKQWENWVQDAIEFYE